MKSIEKLFDLSGKIAIVTGAGSGLGVMFSEALAAAGATVVCVGIRAETVERTAARINAMGHQASGIQLDVTDDDAITQVMQDVATRFGSVDILVNNAGIATMSPPEAMTRNDWQSVIDVNLTGAFICAREAAKVMIAAKRGGSIINIASILGRGASEPAPAASYAASKGGVVNLTRDLAVHWAQYGIRVNAIGPAYFPSAMTEPILAEPEVIAEIERRTPLARMGRLEELQGPILFFASEASSYVTGQTLYVDGGWTAW
jgi:gluconate 5-dehydrogenase